MATATSPASSGPPKKPSSTTTSSSAPPTASATATTIPTPAELFPREWQPRMGVIRDASKYKITFMNWNVLADGLNGLYGAKSKTFSEVPREYLVLEHRVPLMIAEIAKWNCDVICMQEFDLYKDEGFMNNMDDLGYVEAVRQIKRWSPCVTVRQDLPKDGVVIFVKKGLFDIGTRVATDQEQHKRWVENALKRNPDAIVDGRVRIDKIVEIMGEDGPRIGRVMEDDARNGRGLNGFDGVSVPIDDINQWIQTPKPPVSAAIELHPKSAPPDFRLYVMTTHLVASKKLKGEKQRYEELHDLLNDESHARRKDCHTFLCFDMNGSFTEMNGYPPMAYRYLTGSLPSNAVWSSEMKENVDEAEEVAQFFSATRDYKNDDVEQPWSSWKKRKEGDEVVDLKYGVDFVFYPMENWSVTRVSSLPDENEMKLSALDVQREHGLESEPTPLPNKRYPSDHVAVCVELQFEG